MKAGRWIWPGLLAAGVVLALGARPFDTGRRVAHGDLLRDRVVKLNKAENAENILATHDPDSDRYNGNCLGCHATVLEESSADPRILGFHQAMVPFMPGYNPAHGPSNQTCTQCHDKIDILRDSSGGLRTRVDPELCALCHGPEGPGPVFYQR